jgi:hypothetical protein
MPPLLDNPPPALAPNSMHTPSRPHSAPHPKSSHRAPEPTARTPTQDGTKVHEERAECRRPRRRPTRKAEFGDEAEPGTSAESVRVTAMVSVIFCWACTSAMGLRLCLHVAYQLTSQHPLFLMERNRGAHQSRNTMTER